MTDKDCVANLLSWCSERGFWLDPRIEVVTGPSGVSVVARDASIPVDSIRELNAPRQGYTEDPKWCAFRGNRSFL